MNYNIMNYNIMGNFSIIDGVVISNNIKVIDKDINNKPINNKDINNKPINNKDILIYNRYENYFINRNNIIEYLMNYYSVYPNFEHYNIKVFTIKDII